MKCSVTLLGLSIIVSFLVVETATISIKDEPAVTAPDHWTLVDQESEDVTEQSTESSGMSEVEEELEDNEDLDEDKSPVDDASALKWILYTKSGWEYKAQSHDISELESFISKHATAEEGLGSDVATDGSSTQMEDGPALDVKDDKKLQLSSGKDKVMDLSRYLDEVRKAYYYPEYAIGLLENGCTAFLIGPYHALTTAECVFDSESEEWNKKMDFWRGRLSDTYLGKMEWKHVIIPSAFQNNGDPMHNWALITFDKDFPSPVWLGLAHVSNITDMAITLQGYISEDWGTMYRMDCRTATVQDSGDQCISFECKTQKTFNGGPVLKRYPFQHSKMPLVYGVSMSYEYAAANKAVGFSSDLFWCLCYFMENEGHDPNYYTIP